MMLYIPQTKTGFTVRNLQLIDYYTVVDMDKESGFDVSQWIQCAIEEASNNIDSHMVENVYGAFIDDVLIGYCDLGYADGVISDCPYDSRLLGSVYIKPEYRHHGYGAAMVEQVLNMEQDCSLYPTYLTYLYDDLENFYKPLGFEHVPGTDNVMRRPAIQPILEREV